MFFDDIARIPQIASNTGFSIFALLQADLPSAESYFTHALFLRPDPKTQKISVEQVRDFIDKTTTKQTQQLFLVVVEPETMNSDGANTLLKSLEEPKDNYHFVFLTSKPSALLPTILSRAQIYFLKTTQDFTALTPASSPVKEFAKRLMSARDIDLPDLAKDIAAKKDRNFALEVVALAIEMSYKTFFLTDNSKFLQKLPNLLKLYENISMNGHIKLHFVADML